MNKLKAILVCLLISGASFAEEHQVIVNKYPGLRHSTYSDYFRGEIKRITTVSVSDALAAYTAAAAVTASNNTAALQVYSAAAVVPTWVSTNDAITAMETAAADTYSNVASVVTAMGLYDGATVADSTNNTVIFTVIVADTYPSTADLIEILGSLDGATITNMLNITTAITNNATY